jgi:hypothetical protein
LLIGVAACAAFVVGWHSARLRYAPYSLIPIINEEEQADEAHFERLVRAVRDQIAADGGRIATDPYAALIQNGRVESFVDFQFDLEVVHFDVYELPAKLSLNWKDNARAVLMWLNYPVRDETWVMYMDGTWERRKETARPAKLARDEQTAWDHQYHNAGYPYWTSFAHRRTWLEENENNLVWDPSLRIYVPRKSPATQP